MSQQSNEEFVRRATEKHHGKYDYSKSVYASLAAKLTITCPVHGDFEQTPYSHLRGFGCKKCSKIKISSNTQEFSERATLIHDGKYSYGKVDYVDCKTKVVITCPTHGDFEQTPDGHMAGKGCVKCYSDRTRLTTQILTTRGNIKHDGKYTYDRAICLHSRSKVTITCPIHGDFEQTPAAHLNGRGCQLCQSSKNERRLEDIFRKYNITFTREFKLIQFHSRYEYDFYLPVPNVIVEFHGDHHYVPIKFYGGNDGLRYTERCDREKETIAKAAGIPIVIINTITAKLEDMEYERYVFDCIKTAYTTQQNVYPTNQPTRLS